MKVNGVAGTGAKKDWRIRAVAVTTPYSSTEGFFLFFHNKRRFHLSIRNVRSVTRRQLFDREIRDIRMVHLFGVVGDVKVRVDKENVFGLQVRVGQLVVVQESNGVRQLVADVTHLIQRVRLVVVVLLCFIKFDPIRLESWRNWKTKIQFKKLRKLTRKSKTERPSISKAMHMWP